MGAGSAGVVVVNGQGVPQDYAPAQQWWEKGVLQGNPPAQVHLGWLYELRQGVSQNNVRACMWFNLAGANGNNNEVKHRNALTKRMTPAQMAETQKLAREWNPKTAINT